MLLRNRRILIIAVSLIFGMIVLFGLGRLVYREGYKTGYIQGVAVQWEEDKKIVQKGIQALDEAIETLENTKVTVEED